MTPYNDSLEISSFLDPGVHRMTPTRCVTDASRGAYMHNENSKFKVGGTLGTF